MIWKDFVADVKQMVFPDREASNLVSNHTRYILDGLVELQKRIPQLRSRNFNSIAFGDTFYQCRATIVDPKPNGPLIRLYTYSKPDHCDRIYYHPTTREHMENLMRTCGTGSNPSANLVGPEPKDYYPALGDVSVPPVRVDGADVVAEPTVTRMAFSPSALIGGSPCTGAIDLLEPAPAGGVVVHLSSSNPPVVQVPPTVTVPFGATSATFPITTVLVELSQLVAISATLGSRGLSLDLQVHNPNVTTDKGYRAPSGYFAVIGSQVYVWPHLESFEHVVIEWAGIKQSYQDTDEVLFEEDVQSTVELYVQTQQALREDCDQQKYASIGSAWENQAARLAWWYRKKELLPESPWRLPECCVCSTVSSTTDSGGSTPTPPTPTTFTLYLGNIGQNAPPSYTEAQILAMENGSFGIRTVRSTLNYDKYQIDQTASQLNEYRLICIPTSASISPVSFKSAGFPLPMAELPDKVVIEGVECRIFRTGTVSVGPFTLERQTEITISS